jgi:hypothetical protein
MKLYAQNETPRRGFPYIRKPTASPRLEKGPMAEWLGSALQKLLQRFESASDLTPHPPQAQAWGFFMPEGDAQAKLVAEDSGMKKPRRAQRGAGG